MNGLLRQRSGDGYVHGTGPFRSARVDFQGERDVTDASLLAWMRAIVDTRVCGSEVVWREVM